MSNKIKYIVLRMAIGVLFVGCKSTYSTFESPTDNPQIDSLYSYIEATNDTTNIASLSWREIFTDNKLQTLIEIGLENNSSLNVVRLNIEQAEIALKTARLAFLPSLNAAPQYSTNIFGDISAETYNLAASASWEIDIFGKLRNAKEQSKAALEQSKAYEQTIHTQLISTIANSYYTLLLLDDQLDITLRTKSNWDENIRAMKALMRAGNANEAAVTQAEANTLTLSANIVSLKQQISEIENTLSALLGSVPNHIQRGTIQNVEFPLELSIGVPIQLLSNRPDIKVAEYNVAQMFYGVNYARASLYPTLTIGGSAGYTNNAGVVVDPGDWLFSATASLLLPIFNQGKLKGQLKISESQYQQAIIEFNQAILDAGAEVNKSLIGLQSARERYELDTKQIEILSKTLRATKLLMENGSANYLEVLTAENSLLQAKMSQSNDKFSEIQGVINLYRSLGGGK